MKLIYATGRPRNFEFAVASGFHRVPEGARVLAVCDGSLTNQSLDEHTFGAMTDEEYFTLQSLIASSQGTESAATPATPDAENAGLFRRFLRRMLGH